jgi:Mn2+/Fe2+ NRAMP family transporter
MRGTVKDSFLTPSLQKSSCRSGLLAAIAQEGGAPAGHSQYLTGGEFQNQYTRKHSTL